MSILNERDERPAGEGLRVLLVDLNNHARYPTLAVGQMAAVLRAAGHRVEVVSPLAVGVHGARRDARAKPWSYWDERLRWWTAKTALPGIQRLRSGLVRRVGTGSPGAIARGVQQLTAALRDRPDVVLASSYYMYASLVRALLEVCVEAELPFVVGGPGFTDPVAVQEWLAMEGMTAVFAGECEPVLAELVERVAQGRDLASIPGCATRERPLVAPAAPVEDLDRLPFPDYDGFPWDAYPTRIVSVLTGRGCGWGACSFCSDVLTSNGRGFRTRSLDHVLGELAHHHERYGVRLFHFSDLKLNSDVELWRGLAARLQMVVPGARWTCSVHLGGQGDQGLSLDDLAAARAGGLVRITTGLETGSQALLNAMGKGVRLPALTRFLVDADRADLSVRVSMFSGYPGEGVAELEATRSLLLQHESHIDRVHFSRFSAQHGTPITERLLAEPERFPDLRIRQDGPRSECLAHTDRRIDRWAYRRAVGRLLRVVTRINRGPLREAALELEGAM